MKNSGMFYIICYDSPSNKRRTKLHKTLKNFAVAVQKSVFEAFLDSQNFDRMMKKIYALMDSSVDSVRIYGLSRSAQKKMHVIGFPGRLKDPDFFFIRSPADSESLNRIIIDLEPDEEAPEWL